jgi:hypothetical protein
MACGVTMPWCAEKSAPASAAFLVLGHRLPDHAQRPSEQDRQEQRAGDGAGGDHPVQRRVPLGSGQFGHVGHAIEAAGEAAPLLGRKETQHRQGQRDQREVRSAADAACEHEPADRIRQQGRQCERQRQGQVPQGLRSGRLQGASEEVGTQAEEERVPERQEAEPAPAHRHPLGRDAVDQVQRDLVGDELVGRERKAGKEDRHGGGRPSVAQIGHRV